MWGGQGPWTLFQSLGAGVAGVIAGAFGKLLRNKVALLVSAFIGLLMYEIIVTIPMGLMFSPLLSIYILTSLPFSAIHIISGIGFVATFAELKDKIKRIGCDEIERKILAIRNKYSNHEFVYRILSLTQRKNRE